MSATTIAPGTTAAPAAVAARPDAAERSAAPPRPRLARRRLVTLAVLAGCVAGIVLAVPGLHPAVREIAGMNVALVLGAIGLELASCLSFVVIFRHFFPSVPARPARALAWSQMGSGALLPGGGVGALAVGGWLLHLVGMPTRQIVQRSSALFFLTSAINVLVLAVASLLLALGIADGPHDLLHVAPPILGSALAVAIVLALPRLTRGLADTPRRAWLNDLGAGVPAARRDLLRPSWRLAGAIGYLLFDIAVLWTAFAATGSAPAAAPLVIAYIVGYLANAIPVPGGVGVLDAGLVGALALYGVPLAHAAAAVLVYHAIAFWLPALGGALGYLRVRPQLHSGDATAAEPELSPAG